MVLSDVCFNSHLYHPESRIASSLNVKEGSLLEKGKGAVICRLIAVFRFLARSLFYLTCVLCYDSISHPETCANLKTGWPTRFQETR